MNREQAEHILEAYINLETVGGDNRARAALREVVLDAMTEYRSKPAATLPNIAVPPATTYNVIATSANTDGSTKATCVGLDPLFRTCTAVVER